MENLLERNGIRTFGITEIEEKGLRLCWSASGIEFTTSAKEIVIEMEGESKGREEDAFFAVFVNGERMQYKVQVFPGKKECVLYPESSEEEVSIRILKLTEEQYGKVWISGIRLDGRIWISPASFSDPVEENGEQEESNVLSGDAKQKPHLLFIGDSITAGYGVDGVNGECILYGGGRCKQGVCVQNGGEAWCREDHRLLQRKRGFLPLDSCRRASAFDGADSSGNLSLRGSKEKHRLDKAEWRVCSGLYCNQSRNQ